MANRTEKSAKSVHGTNPQYLVEKIIRSRIYESRFWKEECFGLNAADVLEKATQLRFIGGIYGGNIKPTPFLCLVLKMLQIQPLDEIIFRFIGRYGEKFKYVRALGCFYLRLTGKSLNNWKHLEPIYTDYRKLRVMDQMGQFSVMFMDEFVDKMFRDDRVFDVILPRINKRKIHEESDELEPYVSPLENELQDLEEGEEIEEVNLEEIKKRKKEKQKEEMERKRVAAQELKRKQQEDAASGGRHRSRSRSRSPKRRRRKSSVSSDSDSEDERRHRRTRRKRSTSRDKDRERVRRRSRSRSRSPDRRRRNRSRSKSSSIEIRKRRSRSPERRRRSSSRDRAHRHRR